MSNIKLFRLIYISVFSVIIIVIGSFMLTINKEKTLPDIIDNNSDLELTEVLDNKYNNLTSNVSLTFLNENLDDLNILSGVKKRVFALSSDETFDDIEVTFEVNNSIGKDKDVLALYIYQGDAWIVQGFYEIIGTSFTMETTKLGKYAIVNKSEGNPELSPIITNTSRSTDQNFRNNLAVSKAYTSEEEIVVSHFGSSSYTSDLEYHNVSFKTNETGKLQFRALDTTQDNVFYFENCTFDEVTFHFEHKGHYVFNNCSFINSPISSIEIIGEDVNVYVYNSSLKNNHPDLEEFNTNDSDVRSWKYSAIGFRRNNGSAHVVNTDIEGYYALRTIYETQNVTGNRLYFEYSSIKNVEGQAIGLYSAIKGRIDHNEFLNIGALRGTNGYEITVTEYLGGGGVGGNAIFATGRSREMRVYNNNIKNVMENGIEGHYYYVIDNTVDTTGYRFADGLETVSTQGISGGSWKVTGNVLKNIRGIGISFNHWDNGVSLVSGNTILKGNQPVDDNDIEGIRISPSDASNKNVLVENNVIDGFINKYRVLNNTDIGYENIVIHDTGDGKLMGNVYSALTGVKLTSDRQIKLDFKNANMEELEGSTIKYWTPKNTAEFEQKVENGITYASFQGSNNKGEIYQSFDLPKEVCIVCLTINMRSTLNSVKAVVRSKDDDGNYYESGNGGSYSEYKIPIYNVAGEEFNDYNVCFKALDHSTIGVYSDDINSVVDVNSIEGYYMLDNYITEDETPTNPSDDNNNNNNETGNNNTNNNTNTNSNTNNNNNTNTNNNANNRNNQDNNQNNVKEDTTVKEDNTKKNTFEFKSPFKDEEVVSQEPEESDSFIKVAAYEAAIIVAVFSVMMILFKKFG